VNGSGDSIFKTTMTVMTRLNDEAESRWQVDAIRDNCVTTFGVKRVTMRTPLIPGAPTSAPRVQDSRRVTLVSQDPALEYKVCIAPTNTAAARRDAQEQLLDALGKKGWIFVSESQGNLHFKRLKK